MDLICILSQQGTSSLPGQNIRLHEIWVQQLFDRELISTKLSKIYTLLIELTTRSLTGLQAQEELFKGKE